MKYSLYAVIVFFIITLFMMQCDRMKSPTPTYIKMGERNFEVHVIDSCEYLISGVGSTQIMAHKGNCKYCLAKQNKKVQSITFKYDSIMIINFDSSEVK